MITLFFDFGTTYFSTKNCVCLLTVFVMCITVPHAPPPSHTLVYFVQKFNILTNRLQHALLNRVWRCESINVTSKNSKKSKWKIRSQMSINYYSCETNFFYYLRVRLLQHYTRINNRIYKPCFLSSCISIFSSFSVKLLISIWM